MSSEIFTCFLLWLYALEKKEKCQNYLKSGFVLHLLFLRERDEISFKSYQRPSYLDLS